MSPTRILILVAGYLLVYGALHLGLWLWLRPLWRRHRRGLALAGIFALLILAPVASRALEFAGYQDWAAALARAGYWWMALVILTFLVLGILALGKLTLAAFSRLGLGVGRLLTRRQAAWATVAAPLALAAYGRAEARAIKVRRLRFSSSRLPPGPLRLVLISDLHLNLTTSQQEVARVVALVNRQRPDIVISAGDLVDGVLGGSGHLAEPLTRIRAPAGRFAVLGNHEFYVGEARSLAFIKRAGFVVLRDQARMVAGLRLVGLDDAGHGGRYHEQRLLPPGQGPFTILIKHRPLVNPRALGRFHLQLSGHTHGGQIFPWNLAMRMMYPYPLGLARLPQGGLLYTSRGTGTWGPPIRVLAWPEITVIDLKGSAGSKAR